MTKKNQENQANKPTKKQKKQSAKAKLELKVIPLGGLCEIGKNMTVLEIGNDMIIIDVGMAFAEADMPGVDCVIQDYSYIRQNSHKLRGIILTHGHEDHIGSLPYFLKEFKCPVYGGKLTIELVRHKLQDKGISLKGIPLEAMKNGDLINLGSNFVCEFIRVNHSIADSYAIALRTPLGNIIHSGDFKVDYTPINGKVIDLPRFGEYGKEGVLLFLCESTNIEKGGFSQSEQQVGESFEDIFRKTNGRIIVATFSSHVHRMQQIISAAEKFGRHVCLSGRSMVNVYNVANSLGYISSNPDTVISIDEIDNYEDQMIVILTTGSQAEPMSALSRMAFASHKSVEIREGDTVILSAHPIPGNEKPIYKVIDELFKRGANVIYQSLAEVHVSGHAYQNELRLLHTLLKPKYFVPVHGEYRMLCQHKEMATSMGTPKENSFVLTNGDVLSITSTGAKVTDHVQAAPVLIDGTGVMDPSDRVLAERRQLSNDGIISIGIIIDDNTNDLMCHPSVNSCGFLFDDEKDEIHTLCASKAMSLLSKDKRKHEDIEHEVSTRAFREGIRGLLYDKTRRRPMVLVNVGHVRSK